MKEAKRVSEALPDPPTPTSMALPRGWRRIRAMRMMCSMASMKNTAGGQGKGEVEGQGWSIGEGQSRCIGVGNADDVPDGVHIKHCKRSG